MKFFASFRSNFRFLNVGTCLLTVGIFVSLSNGQSTKCRTDQDDRVKYKIVESYKNNLPPYFRSLRIVVRQKDFNREYMLRLAKSIRWRFCSDNEITAMIFDDKYVAQTMDDRLFLTGKINVPELRGFYTQTSHTISGKGAEHSIEFSTVRGNPTNEVVLKLPPI